MPSFLWRVFYETFGGTRRKSQKILGLARDLLFDYLARELLRNGLARYLL